MTTTEILFAASPYSGFSTNDLLAIYKANPAGEFEVAQILTDRGVALPTPSANREVIL